MKIQLNTGSIKFGDNDDTKFISESCMPGTYNGMTITLEELAKSVKSWVGADVLVGHAPYSDSIVGEITQSYMNGDKLMHLGTVFDPTTISLIKKGKLRPSIGADYAKLVRKDGKLIPTGLKGNHLSFVRDPSCKLCKVDIAMSDLSTIEDIPYELVNAEYNKRLGRSYV